MSYKIAIDSCGELLDEWKNDGRIESIPLTLTVGGENIIDDENFDQKDFFDTDSMNRLTEHGRTHSLWKDIRPFCWSVIRGKRTPLSFRIVLHLSRSGVKAAMRNTDFGISSEQIDGLFLNLQFKNNSLLCTTGTSLKTFSMDKRPEQLWDDMILSFLSRNQILFERL